VITHFLNTLILSLVIMTVSQFSWGKIEVFPNQRLPTNCLSLGLFSATAGYGRSIDGQRIAFRRAISAATKAGASHAVVEKLNRGPTDQGGYCLVEGFSCPEGHLRDQAAPENQEAPGLSHECWADCFEYGFNF
jgi:hypothetical protein